MTISGSVGAILFWGAVMGLAWFTAVFLFLLLLVWWFGRYGGPS